MRRTSSSIPGVAEDHGDAGALLRDEPVRDSSPVSLGDKESRKLAPVKSTDLPRILKYTFRFAVRALSDSELDKILAEKSRRMVAEQLSNDCTATSSS